MASKGSSAAQQEEATFLAIQQVDQARRIQFYARAQDEVIAAPTLNRADRLSRSRAAPRDTG